MVASQFSSADAAQAAGMKIGLTEESYLLLFLYII